MITRKRYIQELKSWWILRATKDAIEQYIYVEASLDNWKEIVLHLSLPLIYLAIWATFPISYPVLSYFKIKYIQKHGGK